MMFHFKTTRFHAFINHRCRYFQTKGFYNTVKPVLLATKTKAQNGFILFGIGCSLATFASIGFAYGERKCDEKLDEHSEKYVKINITLVENFFGENFLTNALNNLAETDDAKTISFQNDERQRKLSRAIKKSLLKLEQIKEETGSPGLVCAVSIDGNTIWSAGLGFADVENGVKCDEKTKMRIASISKALTSIAIGKLFQDKKLDLDAPVQQYVKYFPEKEFEGEAVTITTRQLMSHTSGIRHYEKKLHENEVDKTEKDDKGKEQKINDGEKVEQMLQKEAESQVANQQEAETKKHDNEAAGRLSNDKEKNNEFKLKEYYIKKHYKTIEDAISIFKDDPLLKKPGSGYLYTTHGWTLLSACIEGASGKDYITYMKEMCYDLGLDKTLIELNDPIVYNRSRYYIRDSKGKLKNTPYVDNSYKWAGGGFLSTVSDLVKIGNIMLYSSQNESSLHGLRGYLNKDVVDLFWTPVSVTTGKVSKKRKEMTFGLGWQLSPNQSTYGCCRESHFVAMHSGAAVGASSILVIIPKGSEYKVQAISEKSAQDKGQSSIPNAEGEAALQAESTNSFEKRPPQGIVVAIMVNMQEVGLSDTAFEIANNFAFDL